MRAFAYAPVIVPLLTVIAVAQPTARETVWSGVYTKEQAARGQVAYTRNCGGCHRDDLRGGSDGEPALKGGTFAAEWNDQSLGDFLQFIGESMPKRAPGSLPAATYLDIVAFILRANGMPAGEHELTLDGEKLERIVFTDKPR